MKKHLLTLGLACCLATMSAAVPSYSITDWDFSLGGDFPKQKVQIPHDWSISGPFATDMAAANESAYLPTGKGVYTTTLTAPKGLKATDRIRLYFEGVYMNSNVLLNGKQVGGHPYGYNSFWVDITDQFNRKAENELVVEVDNSAQPNCRWYTGSGIYRDVKLVVTPQVEILPWSLQILTPQADADKATVEVNATLSNHSDKKSNAPLTLNIYAPDSQLVYSEKLAASLSAKSEQKIAKTLSIDMPQLWDIDAPNLYTLEITDKANRILANSTFGIRSIDFSTQHGFRLNGKTVNLNGACVHHDNGVLGARSYPEAEWMKAWWIKNAGFNAIRTSHNPPAESLLDACDKLGLVVIDEAFDGWRSQKLPYDYSTLFDQWAVDDVQRMVLRDRNHPCVIAWSIGNEIIERKSPQAVKDAAMLASAIKQVDTSRPVTQALCAWDSDWEIYDPLAAEHDVVGYNYMLHKAESDHQRVPSRIIWQTESYPGMAFTNWDLVDRLPYVVGDFVWTGLDYLGESGIGRYYYEGDTAGETWQNKQFPWHGAYCGDIDINGHLKAIGHYRRTLWHAADTTTLYLGVREPQGYRGKLNVTYWGAYPVPQSWTWPGHEGKPVDVEVYTRASEVTLMLGDSVIGKARPCRENGYVARFNTTYRPGVLKAVTSSGSEQSIATASEPVAVSITQYPAPEGARLHYYLIEARDKDGHTVPDANCHVRFATDDSSAQILAAANADMTDSQPYTTPECKLWQGRALVVVKAGSNPYKLHAKILK